MNNRVTQKIIADEASMLALGAKLAQVCVAGSVIFLYGQLGAGKTTFTRGFLRGLGYTDRVKSPTYTLVESYEAANKKIYHFDLYRLRDPFELEFMGIRDYFTSESICLVEWPEYGAGVLPAADIVCDIEIQGDERLFKFTAYSPVGITILERMQHEE